MNDRELLELAARAAGMPPEWRGIIKIETDHNPRQWNPLTDDGDALRLAVKLNMLCDFGSHGVLVEAKDGPGPCTEIGDYRRAIVRAAAAIGEAMQ